MFAKLLSRTIRRLARRAHPLVSIARRLRDNFSYPRAIAPGERDRVLVLAPHMDDEAIGCGGAVLLHRACGNAVAVVYLTDGAEGDARLREVDSADGARLRDALRRERRSEALAWCAATGVELSDFLDLPDGRLSGETDGKAVRRLAAIVKAWRPTLVYLPSPLDVHPDHRATNRLALDALREAGVHGVLLRGYEVWTPILANAVMDISDVIDAKARLLGLHASQLRDIDYVRHVVALSAYRSLLLPTRSGHAEAFIELQFDAYARMIED